MDSPMCLIENDNGELCVVQEAISYLMGLKHQIVVVAIVGLYRTGKSYLMNKLAQRKTGFALGATIQSKTKGIWMWCVPHPLKADCTIVLLDTEGLGDVEKGDSKSDTWIFSLAVLLSSTLMDLFVTELTERIKVKATSPTDDEEGLGSQFNQFFPNFVWIVRDFTLQLEIDGSDINADEYLENSLKLKKGYGKKITDYNLPRECIRNFFPSRRCFVFPIPTTADKMQQLDTLDDSQLSREFRNVTDTFCHFIHETSPVKTANGGIRLNGRMLGHLVNTYVDTINKGDVPCLENAILVMAELENQVAVEEAFTLYKKDMEEVKALFPVESSHLSKDHLQSQKHSMQVFMERSFKDTDGKFCTILAEKIKEYAASLVEENKDASERKCKALLEKLCAEMDQGVKDGRYSTPGGYELYCNHHDDLVAHYRAEPNKGVKAEEVLEHFLKVKSTEFSSILQADIKLTENEKQIQAEKMKTSELEQEKAALKEQQEEIARAIESFEQSKEAYLNEMMQKVEMEREEQQKEFDEMLERRMQEQAYLLEQGHKEKAMLLKQEIEDIQKAYKFERAYDIQKQKEMMDDYRNLTQAQQQQIDDLKGALQNKESKQSSDCNIL
uniref:GB1/RHD3-type G domain-containing protein n=1 Tax=Esox lucius TaxID=8010 RepID=A0A3P8YCN2_ESOLU